MKPVSILYGFDKSVGQKSLHSGLRFGVCPGIPQSWEYLSDTDLAERASYIIAGTQVWCTLASNPIDFKDLLGVGLEGMHQDSCCWPVTFYGEPLTFPGLLMQRKHTRKRCRETVSYFSLFTTRGFVTFVHLAVLFSAPAPFCLPKFGGL
ncbi:hypothetical protein CEXT_333481 [Caerostris extrusa]|uniref:Uncharacterized protein n=1 Tax=Caerostris extrusa TaxID=172846 RepID=A0AAV4RSF9_CAEEX|nr:hypothetical protein CEXT_333481 [Caerostris extrusa]